MSHDVFISHSNKDKKWADAVCGVLEQNQVRCWIAPRDIIPGTEWKEAIIEGLNSCKIMVLIFSAHANASPQVNREVDRAIDKGLVILPFRIQDIKPEGSMEYALSGTHWLDALTPPLKQHLDTLADTVRTLLERMGGREVVPVPAQPPESTPVSQPSPALPPVAQKPPQPPQQPTPAQITPPPAERPAAPAPKRNQSFPWLLAGGILGGIAVLSLLFCCGFSLIGMLADETPVLPAAPVLPVPPVVPAAAVAGQNPGSLWQDYSPAAGGFRIKFPGSPAQQSVVGGTLAIFQAANGARYLAQWVPTDYTPFQLQSPGFLDEQLDEASAGFVLGAQGKTLRTDHISLGKAPGREILAQCGDGATCRARLYWQANRMFILGVSHPDPAGLNSADTDYFFSSFQPLGW